MLAVITHIMSAACIPNSSAMADPMNAIDCESKPSSSAMVKHRATTPQRRTFIGLSFIRLNFKRRSGCLGCHLEMTTAIVTTVTCLLTASIIA